MKGVDSILSEPGISISDKTTFVLVELTFEAYDQPELWNLLLGNTTGFQTNVYFDILAYSTALLLIEWICLMWNVGIAADKVLMYYEWMPVRMGGINRGLHTFRFATAYVQSICGTWLG